MPLLLDLEAVPACHCDTILDDLFKAVAADPAGEDRSIWAPHENPWLTALVEDVTGRLQAILTQIQDAFSRLLTGEPIGRLAKAAWGRWSEADLDAARAQLEAKAPSSYTIDDWMQVVDYLLQRYLDDDVIQSEADYLTVRSHVLGKIQAAMAAKLAQPSVSVVAAVSELVPTRFAKVKPKWLSAVERAVLAVSRSRAAIAISNVAASIRSRLKTLVVEHVQGAMLGQKEGTSGYLRQRIFDEFAQLNRDCRRIAVTETGECLNQGFIAAQKPGQKVRRQEAYKGACDFCKSISGRVFTVVDPAAPVKDGETEVWLGKTNVGRSAAPRMRVGSSLVERPSAERWWVAAGVQHPHCRGSWVPVSDVPPDVNPDFAAALRAAIGKATTKGAA